MTEPQHDTATPHRRKRQPMPASLRLGRIAGIPIRLHYSWFIIAAFIAVSLAAHFGATQSSWSTTLIWSVAILTALLFFVSLLAHELSHAVVAQSRQLPVRSITLFALGGVAHIEKDASSARTEFLVAIVGPMTSFLIGGACLGGARLLGWEPGGGGESVAGAVLGWLGSINVVLALFNLVPGYPLDGGRVLRAVLWSAYGNAERATRHAATAGKVVAMALIAVGLFQALGGFGPGGFWLAFIGWFLLSAAQAEYAQTTMGERLKGVRVGDVMSHEVLTVHAATGLGTLVDSVLLRTGRQSVVVEDHGQVLGVVSPQEIRRIDRDRWDGLTARDVMRPIDGMPPVAPDTPAMEAFAVMLRENLNGLPVMLRGHLEGMVSRAQILQLVEARSALDS